MASRKGIFFDISRGIGIPAHQAREGMVALLLAGLFALIVGAALSATLFIHSLSPVQRTWSEALLKAWAVAQVEPGRQIQTPVGRMYPADFLAWHKGRASASKFISYLSLRAESDARWGGLVSAVLFLLMTVAAIRRGRRDGQDRFLRGGHKADDQELAKMIRKKGTASDIYLGRVPMVTGSEPEHLLITGAPGVGKSVLISSLLDRIGARGERAVILDRKGDFLQSFYSPERGDQILNPFDCRHAQWSPWAEASTRAEFARIAAAMVPEAGSKDPFWELAAQNILSNAMQMLKKDGDCTVSSLSWVLQNSSVEELANMLDATSARRLLAPENSKMANSVLGVLGQRAMALEYLPDQVGQEPFSIKEWVQNEDGKGWIFLPSKANQHDILKPLISTWADCLISSVLSLPTSRSRRIWLLLDELPSLQKLPSLQMGLAEGRGFGLCCLLGIQSVSQLREIYGRDGAESLIGMSNTQVHFRSNDPDTAAWISKALGEAEHDEVNESVTFSSSEFRDGVSNSSQRHTRPLVMPTEIQKLEKFHFFIKLPGAWPVAETHVKPVDRPQVAEPFVPAAEKPVAKPMAAPAPQPAEDESPSETDMEEVETVEEAEGRDAGPSPDFY